MLTRGNRTFACNTARFHGDAANLATNFTLIPAYNNCSSSISGSVITFTNTGCHYEYELTAEEGSEEDVFTATTDLDCDHEGHILMELWTSEASHKEGKAPLCAYTFSDTHEGTAVNQDLGEIELTNKAAGGETAVNWITADVELAGIHSTRTVAAR